jgi:hypothetical protein
MVRKALTSDSQGSSSSIRATADFFGNLTQITNPSYGFSALQRQPNCALTLFNGGFTPSFPFSFAVNATTANFELALHNAAGLTTRADLFPGGCTDPVQGIGARYAVSLGSTSQNQYLLAWTLYDNAQGDFEMFTANADATTLAAQSLNANLAAPGIVAVAAGDLNSDGTQDIVGFSPLAGNIAVWLVGADGTIGTAAFYGVPDTLTEALVLADVNGDGHLDAVVATRNGAGQESISVLTGRGDGTFNPAQTFTVATPTQTIANLITADLRGKGYQDIVGSNGIVLLNNGSGQFTAATPAFAPFTASSQYGVNLSAADFNHDGKPDLAVDDGAAIHVFIGKGDGTFTAGNSYASIGNVGYVAATDLDGDGNVDLYSGLGNIWRLHRRPVRVGYGVCPDGQRRRNLSGSPRAAVRLQRQQSPRPDRHRDPRRRRGQQRWFIHNVSGEWARRIHQGHDVELLARNGRRPAGDFQPRFLCIRRRQRRRQAGPGVHR